MSYTDIAGGYSFATLRVGTVLRSPLGQELYFQPGDDEEAIRAIIDSLEEVRVEIRDGVADVVLSEYFLC